MSRIEVTAESTVWQAEADDPAGHGCEPRVTRLASGAIVLSHRVGTTREGGDGRPRLVRSDDDGATWRVLASPFTGALPAGWDLRGCALAELADGGLLAVVVAIDKTSGKPPYNPVTEGLVPVRNLVARSDDGGATWSEPWDLADGRYVQHAEPGTAGAPRRRRSCARSRRSRPTTTRASGGTRAAPFAPTTAAGRGVRR